MIPNANKLNLNIFGMQLIIIPLAKPRKG